MTALARSPSPCAYCGLPVGGAWGQSPGPEGEPRFCCFGCRFAAAVTRERGEQGEATWMLARLGLALFFAMNVMVFTMALWTLDLDPSSGDMPALAGLFRYLCLFLSVPVLWLLGGPLLEAAWEGLRRGTLSTDLLLLLGVAASYLYSSVAVWRDQGQVYFEVGCMVLVLVTLGRWLEAAGKLSTSQALERLRRLIPEEVRVLRQGEEALVGCEEVREGDLLRVLPGERIPCDGVLLHHPAAVDEQLLTGESGIRHREPGERLLGGSLNVEGEVVMSATSRVREGALARLIALVRQAQQSRGRYQQLADRVAAGFLPLVIAIALAATWYHGRAGGLQAGIQTGLAVVLIACPCALGLATPLAVWTALGRAARAQVLFRNSETVERLSGVRGVCLDKTGTLTTGEPTVECFLAEPAHQAELIRRVRRLSAGSSHAHARAILRYLGAQAAGPGEDPWQVRTLPGRGVQGGAREGESLSAMGSPRLMEEMGLALGGFLAEGARDAMAEGKGISLVGWGDRVRGVFVLEEEVRPEAAGAIAELRDLGLEVCVLTGDHAGRGAALARALGVEVRAGLLPEDKVAEIARLRARLGPVAMVGDGINDAPALTASDVGLAMGCGADLARDSAGVCLLGNDLLRAPWGIRLARQTVRAVRLNLLWAFGYNVVGIGLACTGRLNPILAAVAMVASSLLVVANSRRLAGWEAKEDEAVGPVSLPEKEVRAA